MFYLAQRNPKWKNIKLGTCKDTFGQSGCKLMSSCMLAYRDPIQVNSEFIKNKVYTNGCLLDDKAVAKALDLKFDGRSTKKPSFITMAETNHFASVGVPSHFFVFAPKGTVSDVTDLMLDPLDDSKTMSWKPVKYKITSYRLFYEKKPQEDTELNEALKWSKDVGIAQSHEGTATKAETILMLYRLNNIINKI